MRDCWFSKIAAAARKPFTITAATAQTGIRGAETDSRLLILFCGYMWGRGENAFPRTKVTTISSRLFLSGGIPVKVNIAVPEGRRTAFRSGGEQQSEHSDADTVIVERSESSRDIVTSEAEVARRGWGLELICQPPGNRYSVLYGLGARWAVIAGYLKFVPTSRSVASRSRPAPFTSTVQGSHASPWRSYRRTWSRNGRAKSFRLQHF